MNTIYIGKIMYAIFSNAKGKYVQPCKITKIDKNGFWAQCHNGGNGLEYFTNETIRNGVYFSKDTAEKLLEKVS